MAKPPSLDKVVAKLVELEQGPLPDAKETVGAASALKADLKQRLTDGEALPDKSQYFAHLKKGKGRVSYRGIYDSLIRQHPELAEEGKELIAQSREEHPSYRVKYGIKQLDLFRES